MAIESAGADLSFLGDVGNDLKGLATGVVKIGKDISMEPAEIAHWALGEMFGGGSGELHQIAAELTALGQKMDALGKEIETQLGKLSWHGPASDAFVSHARSRVRELNGMADDLGGLGKSVDQLGSIY